MVLIVRVVQGWLRRWAVVMSVGVIGMGASSAGANPVWISAWWAPQSDAFASVTMDNQTLRQVLTVAHSGQSVRVRLSNLYGRTPVVLDAVHIGAADVAPLVVPGSSHPLRFEGQTQVTLAPGASVWSDPVAMEVRAMQRLSLSFHATGRFVSLSRHANGDEFLWRAPGNRVADEGGDGFAMVRATSWMLVDAVDVQGAPDTRVVAIFGDSLVEGFISAPGVPLPGVAPTAGRGARPIELLMARYQAQGQPISVVNAGIGGNRLLSPALFPTLGPSGLSRMERDVIAVSGVTDVIMLFGINDLGLAAFPHAGAMIAGLREATARLRAAGLRVYLGTISSGKGLMAIGTLGRVVGGLNLGVLHGRESVNRARVAINRWIREEADADGVIDFDACLRDPAAPNYLLPLYDSGDHLHPGAAGYAAMAHCIDLPIRP